MVAFCGNIVVMLATIVLFVATINLGKRRQI